MKKILFTLAMIAAFAGSALAQPATSWKNGITRDLGIYKNTLDSVHTLGTLTLINPDGTRRDSVSITVSYQDSARIALVLGITNAFGTTTDTASVTIVGGDKIIDATAAGQTVFPWFAIRNAFGDKIHGAQAIVVKAIVYVVGTEVYASGKKWNTRALVWD